MIVSAGEFLQMLFSKGPSSMNIKYCLFPGEEIYCETGIYQVLEDLGDVIEVVVLECIRPEYVGDTLFLSRWDFRTIQSGLETYRS